MKIMSIQVQRKFQVPMWNEEVKQSAIDFWSRRRIKFDEISQDTLIGRRGNLFGNLTSFDMSKLMAKLLITVSDNNEVDCVLDINTIFQQITPANRIWWDLEMRTFESFLLRNDEEKEAWESFSVYHKKAAWKWVFVIIFSSLAIGIALIIF